MSPVSIALVGVGAILITVGYLRARGPWRRYQALQEQDRNVARYESWRGGVRDSGTTGASVAMQILRRQARDGALIAVLGFVLLVAGFALP
jgi:hypothetical protein